MKGVNQAAHGAFLKQKQALISTFKATIYGVLEEMGEDVKGISWFSSAADNYTASKQDKAA